MKRKPTLINEIDALGEALIKDAKGNTIPGVEAGGEFKARVEAFNAVVRWAMVKHRIYPEEPGESGLERLTRELNGAPAPNPNGDGRKAGSP